ncbi:MAG: CDP-diacylglycerol--glycerol-3-phosphate 3-phosphatidyltransferase [Spirochaetes bacterium]|nr:CDP-diacylglycerol--glycerol-3-phosphate 3-phosphatidyltransferase [Spirochaetota bacterium]
MSLADKFTLSRLLLAPVFFAIYQLPAIFPGAPERAFLWTIPLLWVIAIFAELTDMFDGMAARRRGEISDFGKLFDPFADTLLHITYMLIFVMEGIFPAFLFLLVLYREFTVLFIRNLMMKKGVTMGARLGGKIKTVTYVAACAAAFLAITIERFEVLDFLYPVFRYTALGIFIVSVILSVSSFIDYYLVFKKTS